MNDLSLSKTIRFIVCFFAKDPTSPHFLGQIGVPWILMNMSVIHGVMITSTPLHLFTLCSAQKKYFNINYTYFILYISEQH